MRKFEVYCFMVLSYASSTVFGSFNYSATKPNDEWWSNTIIYQVYPRSFKDSNKDGVGDLKGIIQKLDYFVELGIETLWIGPLFKSPMLDMGYDVENYKMVDPIFGTMDDFDELIVEMNKRNLKLITDLVPNHSSNKCEWFQKSIKREGQYEDYYVWRDAKNQAEVIANSSVTPIVPNNWMGIFGGSAWTWNTERKQFFYHQFNAKQPDFNIRNPKIHQELFDILEFWMDKGVTGFRFDALKHLYESASFEDEPYVEGKEGSDKFNDMIHIYTLDQPEVIDTVHEWRKFLDDYTKKHNLKISKIMTTESYSKIPILMDYYGNATDKGAQIPFNFVLFEVDRNNIIETIDKSIKLWLNSMPENMVANWVMENHDNPRTANRFGPEAVPMFIAIKLALPGVDVTYYGGEIGLENTYVRPDQRQDPNNAGAARVFVTRDGERCPMQWDASINAGFTEEKKTWLPVNPNYYKLNVEAQKKMPKSNYNIYKKMSQLRKTNTLKYGGVRSYNISQSIYIIERSLADHESYFVVTNFGSETETVVLSNIISNLGEKLHVYLGSENTPYDEGNIISTTSAANSNLLQLRPQSVVVLTDKVIIPSTTEPPTTNANPVNSCGRLGPELIIVFGLILFTRYFSYFATL